MIRRSVGWCGIVATALGLMALIGVTQAEMKGQGGGAHEGAKWLTDFEAAKKKAAATGNPILVNFSGSDWCGWCIRLDKEVLSKPAFRKYARENLVLFLADFPRRKQQPAKLKKQNQELDKRYGVRGFPTILLVNADGKKLAQTGYQPGGPEAYTKHLNELLSSAAASSSESEG